MHAPQWLEFGIQTYGYWVVLVAVALESMGIPFPGETSLLAAAVYAGTGERLSIVLVIVAAAVGAILGDNIGYLVGRRGGEPLLRAILRRLRIEESALDGARRFFARHGDVTVFASRFASVLRTTVPFLSGVNGMPWRTFVFWNAVGGIIWAIIYGTLGYVLGRNLPLLDRVLHVLGTGGVVVIVLSVVVGGVYWFRRRRGRREPHEEQQMARHTRRSPGSAASEEPETPPEGTPEAARQRHHDLGGMLSATSQRSGDLLVSIAAERRRRNQRRLPPKPDRIEAQADQTDAHADAQPDSPLGGERTGA